jgi:AcrR family transcriptional regulator
VNPREQDRVPDIRSSRDRVVSAASRSIVDMFIDNGRTDFTVLEMARHAGISERSFYRYFPRKEDVIRPFLTGGFERITGLVEARPEGEPIRETLVAAWSESWVATGSDRSRRLYRLLFDDAALRAVWFEIITVSEAHWASAIARRLDIDPASRQAALIGAVVVAAVKLSTRSFSDSAPHADPAADFAANLALIGSPLFTRLATPPRRKAGRRA